MLIGFFERREVNCFLLLVLGISIVFTFSPFSVARAETKPPNVLLIVSDDQRYEDVDRFMPKTWSMLFRNGTSFSKAYVTTPKCCPSRSSILTGMYASKHKVISNSTPLLIRTVANDLHEHGYFTGLIGKYLNSSNGNPRDEFDYWVSFRHGSSLYINPKLNVNGNWQHVKGYITYILRDHSLQFVKQAAQQEKPFFLYLAPNAPHAPAKPAPGHEGLYAGLAPHRPPHYDEADRSDKPEWLQERRMLTQRKRRAIDSYRLRQLQTLKALDDSVAAIIDQLEKLQLLDSTVIMFISDNGVMWGEHGLDGKDCVYESAIHVPFAIRDPLSTTTGKEMSELVANIDIAPTIWDIAGLNAPTDVDGASLLPLLRQSGTGWRKSLLIEHSRTGMFRVPFVALHTGDTVYVENRGDLPEFYDLKVDPFQLTNVLASNPSDDRAMVLKTDLYKLLEQVRPEQWPISR